MPAIALLLASTSCGSGSTTAQPPVDGARGIEIVAESLTFRPAAIKIAAGEDVAVTLRSADAAHDLTVDGAGFHLHVEAGKSGSGALRVDAPGTYRAYCSVPGHREAGMEMVLTVTGKVST
ncbi:MAG: plastocyanin/azurin family copper-binding protein [Acidimicrobiales bacterium]